MRHRRTRQIRPRRITEEQRSATEEAYLNSLKNPSIHYSEIVIPVSGRGKKLKDYHPKRSGEKVPQVAPSTYIVPPTKQQNNSVLIAIMIALAFIALILASILFSLPSNNQTPDTSPTGGSISPNDQFCSTQNCSSELPNTSEIQGSNKYTVACNDGTSSSSGSRRGACSYHDGEIIHSSKIYIRKR